MQLAVDRFGTDGPILVLLHGLGANGAVWARVLGHLRNTWPGTIVVPDLRGHGRSPWSEPYSLGQHAADIAALVPAGSALYLAGHSMGGAIALVIASGWFGHEPRGVLPFSMKTRFGEDERAKLDAFARTPPKRFATRAEATERYLRVAGLAEFAADASETAQRGVRERDGAWELATDPATVRVAGPDLAGLFAVARAPLHVATGESDPIAPPGELRPFAPQLAVIPGAGHNVHVEQPAVIAERISALIS